MARKISRRTIVIVSAVLLVLVALIGTIAVIRATQPNEKDPYKTTETSSKQETSVEAADEKETVSENSTKKPTSDQPSAESALDPATVGTIEVAPLSLTVSYVKGVGGFEYEVLRTPGGTQYVEFSSAELAGTKCTDDTGVFVSILVGPKESEASTLAKTVTVDGTKYGLSLAGTNCTSDASKLQSYQKSFSDAFGLLKKTN